MLGGQRTAPSELLPAPLGTEASRRVLVASASGPRRESQRDQPSSALGTSSGRCAPPWNSPRWQRPETTGTALTPHAVPHGGDAPCHRPAHGDTRLWHTPEPTADPTGARVACCPCSPLQWPSQSAGAAGRASKVPRCAGAGSEASSTPKRLETPGKTVARPRQRGAGTTRGRRDGHTHLLLLPLSPN